MAWPQSNNKPLPELLMTQFANKYMQATDNSE